MKKVNIYQINTKKDTNRIKFMPSAMIEANKLDPNIYEEVFRGEFTDNVGLEDIFYDFNIRTMAGFKGHSLSVSDIVQVTDGGLTKNYFVDDIGFTEVDFDSSNIQPVTGFRSIAVPDSDVDPYIVTMPDDMHAWQAAVNGYFDIAHPFEDNVFVLCNDEGKYNGMKPNRDLGFDVVYGPFVLMADNEESWTEDLTDEQIQKYMTELIQLTAIDYDDYDDEEDEEE